MEAPLSVGALLEDSDINHRSVLGSCVGEFTLPLHKTLGSLREMAYRGLDMIFDNVK